MKVRELIELLSKCQNKDLDVVTRAITPDEAGFVNVMGSDTILLLDDSGKSHKAIELKTSFWIYEEQENKDELKTNVMNKVFQIANNAIYFRDSSDYLTALYEICDVIKPGDETVGEKFIEEVGDVNNDQT